MGPILEKVVRGANGAVRMVKLNIDENPEIAQQMRIQSIPAVYAFKDGRPVDGFVGAVPESQIKQFVQRLGGGRTGRRRSTRRWRWPRRRCKPATTTALPRSTNRSCSTSPTMSRRSPALRARWSRAANSTRRASCSGACRQESANHAEIAAARSALDLAEQAQKAMGSAGALQQRLQQNPDDHEARLELATALFGAGQREEAIDELLTLFKRDRDWNEQAARKQLVKFFEAMGRPIR